MYEKRHKIPTNNIFTGKTVHILSTNTEEFVKKEICCAVEQTHGISNVQLKKELVSIRDLSTTKTLRKYCDDLVKEKKIKCDESGKNTQWIPITSRTFEELTDDLKKITKSIAESTDKITKKFKDQSNESQIELHELLNKISEDLKHYANQKMADTSFLWLYKQYIIKSSIDRTMSKVGENYSDDLYDKIGLCLHFLLNKCNSLISELTDHNSHRVALGKNKGHVDVKKKITKCEESLSSYHEDFWNICGKIDQCINPDELQKLYEKLEKKYPKQWSLQ